MTYATDHSRARVSRATDSQRAGLALAISRGDLAEEKRRLLALGRLQAREATAERSQADFAALLLRLRVAADRVGQVDWLERLAQEPKNGIGDQHLRAAEALRDHAEALHSGGCEIRERVDGGKIHNGQMEALCDRRRPGRYAANAAIGAVTDQRLLPGVIAIVIWKRSVPQALSYCGFSKSGKMHGRMIVAVVEALDAAAAHIGIAK